MGAAKSAHKRRMLAKNLKSRPEERKSQSGVKGGTKRLAVNYSNAVKNIRLHILPEQILIREAQEIINDLIIMKIYEDGNNELMFIAIRFRPGIILVDYATEDTLGWLRTKLSGWKWTKLSTCARMIYQ